MKIRVQIARSQREYADVIVDAPSVEAAETYVEQLLEDGNSDAYCDMVNAVSWNTDSDPFDQEVLDAYEHEDQDEDADVTVPTLEMSHDPGYRPGVINVDDDAASTTDPDVPDERSVWGCNVCHAATLTTNGICEDCRRELAANPPALPTFTTEGKVEGEDYIICVECQAVIPQEAHSLGNRWHADSCSLRPANMGGTEDK